ncbi:L-rhamnose 1-dehydrogenase (short-chain dehydrogenase) [Teratosphaeria destructans]|uniref:L-rhamnose 1-dehydrogenase (Short-chain dehydrogenase) n=1 Tax=Teratosphaeria destructans TaxID=418781 RepID=A0A9W7W812_9PEZI|nr:L-rhamnose 1-dehydrogenase (short-chain dehydrogenase) [Teratosphaeria destructans]
MAAQLLLGKSAAVTGGVTGIGRAIALEYLRQGAAVTVNHLNDPESRQNFETLRNQAPRGAKLAAVGGDIGQKSTGLELVETATQTGGGLDIFVANAGVSEFKDFLSLDEDTLERHIHTNIKGTFWTTQAAANLMVAQNRGGSIIGISSISAHLGGAQQVHYTPTKAAVLSMMQSQACALGKYGIRCNALLPGTTRTQLAAGDLADGEKRRYLETRTPLGRVAESEDMAGPAVFLGSDLSRFVSGAQILVDGGISVSLQ